MNISRKNFLVGAAATAITAPAVERASLGGNLGRARGLLGGCFTGCMMAQSATKLSAKSYVQDGLVFQVDAIENQGYGLPQNKNTVYWKDLVTNRNLPSYATNPAFFSWGDYSLTIRDGFGGLTSDLIVDDMTIEFIRIPILDKTYVLRSNNNRVASISVNGSSYGGLYLAGKTYFSGRIDSWNDVWNFRMLSICNGFTVVADAASGLATWNLNGVDNSTFTHVYDGIIKAPILSPIYQAYAMKDEICAMRAYNRTLTPAELTINWTIDKARFNLP